MIMSYATWNIQGIDTKYDRVSNELQRLKFNVGVLTETKKNIFTMEWINSNEQRAGTPVKLIDKPRPFNVDRLKDESTQFLYKLRAANYIKTQDQKGDSETLYKKLKESFSRATAKHWARLGEGKEKKCIYEKRLVTQNKDEAWENKCGDVQSLLENTRSNELEPINSFERLSDDNNKEETFQKSGSKYCLLEPSSSGESTLSEDFKSDGKEEDATVDFINPDISAKWTEYCGR
ncbi:hypothetical protein ILUMI_06604 [Ignelater luminosus]|uniref:Uncharacterized protein n=1 Tax=Ignelater luminosus TaxID=2038154 RepID=A0A8K0D9X7_IGNLU|nr:hypothetical protein ILUMI_06604 [Ignelater luminosus]